MRSCGYRTFVKRSPHRLTRNNHTHHMAMAVHHDYGPQGWTERAKLPERTRATTAAL